MLTLKLLITSSPHTTDLLVWSTGTYLWKDCPEPETNKVKLILTWLCLDLRIYNPNKHIETTEPTWKLLSKSPGDCTNDPIYLKVDFPNIGEDLYTANGGKTKSQIDQQWQSPCLLGERLDPSSLGTIIWHHSEHPVMTAPDLSFHRRVDKDHLDAGLWIFFLNLATRTVDAFWKRIY